MKKLTENPRLKYHPTSHVKVLKGKTVPLRWAIIHVTMPSPEDLMRGMEIATTFEERHGNKPPMYFARYTEDNTIRITVLTSKTDKELKKLFVRLGAFKIKSETKGGGSWEHCHMYQVAKHCFGKKPVAIQEVIHWLYNMTNYNYLQECVSHASQINFFLSNMFRMPNDENTQTQKAVTSEPSQG